MTEPPAPPGDGGVSAEQSVCARHPDRRTGLRCSRCDRPACPACLREAAVGYQCVDCVREGKRTTRTATTVAGAQLRSTPIVVPTLIAANVVVFVITVVQAHSLNRNIRSPLFNDWSLWPPIVAYGEWWRLFTSGFLHLGPIHLLLNMVALWVVGRDLELLLGRLRFSVLYVLSLFGGGISVFMFGDRTIPVAGASGAIFGLLGAIVVVIIRLRLDPRRALIVVGLNIVISVTVPGISLLGHLGGLMVGALAAVGMVYPSPARRTLVQAGTTIGLVLVLVALFYFRLAQFGSVFCIPDMVRCIYRH